MVVCFVSQRKGLASNIIADDVYIGKSTESVTGHKQWFVLQLFGEIIASF